MPNLHFDQPLHRIVTRGNGKAITYQQKQLISAPPALGAGWTRVRAGLFLCDGTASNVIFELDPDLLVHDAIYTVSFSTWGTYTTGLGVALGSTTVQVNAGADGHHVVDVQAKASDDNLRLRCVGGGDFVGTIAHVAIFKK